MLVRLNFLPERPLTMMKQSPNSQSQPSISRRVAVIGAGAGGLLAARELRREGHSVVVFERGSQIGGIWVCSPETESDPLGVDPDRTRVHSSLYKSLRTNLPRELMGVRDYPFVPREGEDRDPRRFPGHGEVLKYLEDFANHFGICKLVRFRTEVVFAGLVELEKWRVRFRTVGGAVDDEIFDAVVVCVGNYSQPRVAEIPGIDGWPGEQVHSHNYRDPEPFRGKVVVVIGFSSSGTDISLELLGVAKEVHISCRSAKTVPFDTESISNVSFHPMIESVHKDGSVVFQDGAVVLADVILHCTGYKYHFPFLETNGVVTVDDNRVGPLYKHVFPPALARGLSFVGLPFKVAPFPMFELQGNWVAGVLSNRIALPSKEEMLADVKAFYAALEAFGKPKRLTHEMGEHMPEYFNWLAATCGCPAFEEWRKQMYVAAFKSKIASLESYRDKWPDDDELIRQAYEEFSKYTSNERSKNHSHLNV